MTPDEVRRAFAALDRRRRLVEVRDFIARRAGCTAFVLAQASRESHVDKAQVEIPAQVAVDLLDCLIGAVDEKLAAMGVT